MAPELFVPAKIPGEAHVISAVVLAAGRSQRMGRPKMTLPWGDSTVIGQVVSTLSNAGLDEILVVTGGAHQEVEGALQGAPCRLVFNPEYAAGEMTRSLQAGLEAADKASIAALVVLGDQPQIELSIVRSILAEFLESQAELVVPSFQMRRGHPWVITRSLWPEVLAIRPPNTLRDFLSARNALIHYYPVASASVLMDLDTPEDYQKYHPLARDIR